MVRRNFLVWGALCLILLLGGCVEVQGVEEQTETAVPPTADIASADEPTATQTSAPAATAVPTETALPTTNATETPPPPPSPTATTAPAEAEIDEEEGEEEDETATGRPPLECVQTSVGFTPLSDLGTGTYMGAEGGLYPGGVNVRPAAHEAAGLQIAGTIQPLAPDGTPDLENGRIVLLSLGMSNASREFLALIQLARRDPERNSQLVIINGAQSRWTADRLYQQPAEQFWGRIEERLEKAGVTPAQVQIIWMNQARAEVGNSGEVFPEYPQILQIQMQDILMTAQQRYPQLKQAFLSNRIYAGYAVTPLNPEPYAYETGFAIKWLIEAQLNGEPGLNYDPDNGPVVMPWLSWGPDVWADGLTPRSDGLIWECADFTWDGTHPSDVGSEKVGQMLLEFFKTDSVTGWFLAAPAD